MAGNNNLHAANKAKKDEFYTQLVDIENELKHYKAHFKDNAITNKDFFPLIRDNRIWLGYGFKGGAGHFF